MGERRWGFAGLSDEEFARFTRSDTGQAAPSRPPPAPDEVVTVAMDADGEIVGVTLAPAWREAVDPRRLGAQVVVAVARAQAGTLAANQQDPQTGAPVPPPTPEPVDLSPWGGSLTRLVAAASADVQRFSAATSAAARRVVTATSAGRHVSGAARHGVVTEVDLDATWAHAAPAGEIEGELRDVLARLRHEAVPSSLRRGPTDPATRMLQRLAADPATLMRLVGMAT